MTKIITTGQIEGNSTAVGVTSGQYMLAVGGEFDGATVTVRINVGPVKGAPVNGAIYTEAEAEVIWLPDCTIFVSVTNSGAGTSVDAAIASLATVLK